MARVTAGFAAGVATAAAASPAQRQQQQQQQQQRVEVSSPSAEGVTPGGGQEGGKRIHFLEPLSTAFQASITAG